jgi:hypothetical protein
VTGRTTNGTLPTLTGDAARAVVSMLTGESGTARPAGTALTCRGCGHRWTTTAKDASTLRCPRCGKPTKVKRAASAPAGMVPAGPLPAAPARQQDSRPAIPGLQPSAVPRCEWCAQLGRKGTDGRNAVADWHVRVTFADGTEEDGYGCTRDVKTLVGVYAGRGARVRLDPAGPVN